MINIPEPHNIHNVKLQLYRLYKDNTKLHSNQIIIIVIIIIPDWDLHVAAHLTILP